MDTFKIRIFNKTHIREVLELWKSTREIYLHRNSEDSYGGISSYLKRNKGHSLVAVNKKKEIIGALLCGHDGRKGFIYHLAVKKDYRNMGIGKKLMEMAAGKLKKSGIQKCVLFVLKDNLEGQAFYKNAGWEEEDLIISFSKITE